MLEYILLGIIQGVAEWLPVSSEGLIVLAKTHLFSSNGDTLNSIIRQALFLHLGTFFAALVYFRREVCVLLNSFVNYKKAAAETKKTLVFLVVSTSISGLLGILLLHMLSQFENQINLTGKAITLAIGLLLFITAFLQIKNSQGGTRTSKDIRIIDGIILGVAQGFAALPGLSRSGLTVSALLLRKVDKATSIRLSFLMSLPIVLLGNIVLNMKDTSVNGGGLFGMVFSFIFGILTIHALLKIAQKINFGYFVLGFAILTLGSLFI